MQSVRTLSPSVTLAIDAISSGLGSFMSAESGAMASASASQVAGPSKAEMMSQAVSSPVSGDPMTFLLGMPSGSEIAKPLGRGDNLLSEGESRFRPDSALVEREKDSPGPLGFLLDQGQQEMLAARGRWNGNPGRDAATLLPLEDRLLALVATLFGARTPSPEQNGQALSDPLNTLRQQESEADTTPTPAQTALARDAALLRFLAGVDGPIDGATVELGQPALPGGRPATAGMPSPSDAPAPAADAEQAGEANAGESGGMDAGGEGGGE